MTPGTDALENDRTPLAATSLRKMDLGTIQWIVQPLKSVSCAVAALARSKLQLAVQQEQPYAAAAHADEHMPGHSENHLQLGEMMRQEHRHAAAAHADACCAAGGGAHVDSRPHPVLQPGGADH